MTGTGPVIVIPAYQPEQPLLDVLRALEGHPVVVVNDGSAARCQPVFDAAAAMPHVTLIEHAVNLGKGAALRTGINYALCRYRQAAGVVTADADGQHAPEDILRVAARLDARPAALILGAREFARDIPLRSRFGNQITRTLFRVVQGPSLRDTQTGLRGIPRALAETMLRSTSSGYEFELDMLIVARNLAVPMEEVPIQTLYYEGNRSSHFDPLVDSMRIYFVLLRFAAASAFTALCDNGIFYFALGWFGAALPAQITARIVAVLVNFNLNRRVVFLVRGASPGLLPRYLLVVLVSGTISYLSLMSVHTMAGIPLVWAKVLVETVMFFANFTLMRDFVFVRTQAAAGAIDWDSYYQRVPTTARLTRRYTARRLVEAVRRGGLGTDARPVLLEFGGGNSCFLDALEQQFSPGEYHVADTNRHGLELLRGRGNEKLHLHHQQTAGSPLGIRADLVFSIGLIEHFDPQGTAQAIAAHFDHAKPGGLVLLSAPRPTWLYRTARGLLERLGIWNFPDERPLTPTEVAATAALHGELLWEQTLWPIVLTQHMMLYRKR